MNAVHDQYGKPVWVTEWVLADWTGGRSFSAAEQAAFARTGAEMMDALDFVERHAWFTAYEGGDGWYLNGGLCDAAGNLTEVGRVFADLTAARCAPDDCGQRWRRPAERRRRGRADAGRGGRRSSDRRRLGYTLRRRAQ
nr:glycosyl hydrolase [Rhodovulum sp. MB263]